MSKSLKRVRSALEAAGLPALITEMEASIRTAAEAAAAVGSDVDQIAKSVILRGIESDTAFLFVTAGGNRVDPDKAAGLTSEALVGADAGFVRKRTGFVIGGVAPVGHLAPPRAFFDPRLLEFETIWAAAGTPRHVFAISSDRLVQISKSQVADFK